MAPVHPQHGNVAARQISGSLYEGTVPSDCYDALRIPRHLGPVYMGSPPGSLRCMVQETLCSLCLQVRLNEYLGLLYIFFVKIGNNIKMFHGYGAPDVFIRYLSICANRWPLNPDTRGPAPQWPGPIIRFPPAPSLPAVYSGGTEDIRCFPQAP